MLRPDLGTASARYKEEIVVAVPVLVTAGLHPGGGLPGNSRWDSGLATMQLSPSLSLSLCHPPISSRPLAPKL